MQGQDLVPWAASTAERWELSLERAIVRQEAAAELRRSLLELTVVMWEQRLLGVLGLEFVQ